MMGRHLKREDEGAAQRSHQTNDHGMEFGHYYVVEVSFRPNNPVFRCIAFNPRGNQVVLASGGLDRDDCTVRLDQLAFFRVVEEIKAMQDQPSRFMPPSFNVANRRDYK